ncbi:AMP-binding protein [Pseudonocardia sp. NPDC049154]|uniref:AMP-binding protein n=1 Tax=Pseudonocardia sp. NPDC049154 TaxID=3155501 RepID=UPI00340CFF3F
MSEDRPNVRAASFYRYAQALPDRVALVAVDGSTTTYAALAAAANRVSHGLRRAGLGVGDRVGVLVGNTPRFLELMLGAGQVGVQIVPVNTHLTVAEVAYILDNSDSRTVFADGPLLELAAAAVAELGRPAESIVAIDAPDPGPHRTFTDFLDRTPDTEPAERVHAQAMLYTSGTTGRPKGVTWPISAVVDPETQAQRTDPIMALRGMRHDSTAVTLVSGPLYHGAPGSWALQGLHHGHTVLLTGKWEAEDFLRRVQEHGVTTCQVAPIHFHRLLQLPAAVRQAYDVSSLQVVSHAGAATPVDVKQRMMDWWGPVLWEYYASSEGWGTSITPEEWLAHPGSVGRHDGNGATMKILDEEGTELPAGEPGMLWIRNPNGVNTSYLHDPEKTAANRRGDYYTAGDMGYIDSDGWLYIVDRRTDLILSGAVNIYPAEIEDALRRHSRVSDVAVVGVPDPEWGQRVRAIVVPAEGGTAGPELAEEIRAFATRALARFKVPREIEFRDSLPYSPTGKLLRRELRAAPADA